MMDPYLNSGHTLTVDNWYTTPRSAKEYENMLAMKYRGIKDKKAGKAMTIHVILTKHSATMVKSSKVDGQGNIVRNPDAIVYYDTNMGGV